MGEGFRVSLFLSEVGFNSCPRSPGRLLLLAFLVTGALLGFRLFEEASREEGEGNQK